MLSSHLLEDLNQVCDRVAVMNHGGILFFGSVAELATTSLASWELAGHIRLRTRVGITAAVVPACISWLAYLRLPADARWWDISCNITFFAALSLIATAFLARLAGPAIGLLGYAAIIVIQQTAPQLAARLPVSGASTNLIAHPVASSMVAVEATAAWFFTMVHSRLP